MCQNGFKGCCSVDPCAPGDSCPDTTTRTSSEVKTMTATKQALSTPAGPLRATIPPPSSAATTEGGTTVSLDNSAITSAVLGFTFTMTTTTLGQSSTLIRSATTVADLRCPDANGTTYIESNKNSYNILCSQDSNGDSVRTREVNSGGFSSCVGACDNVTSCAGFTYVGLDGGSCYLKQSLPDDGFVAKAGINYISLVRVNRVNVPLLPSSTSSPTAFSSASSGLSSMATVTSSRPSSSSSSIMSAVNSGPSTAAIAGGVVGGVVGLVLLLLLVAFLIRSRRKQRYIHRHASKSVTYNEPVEGSTKGASSEKDQVFAPYGGMSVFCPPLHMIRTLTQTQGFIAASSLEETMLIRVVRSSTHPRTITLDEFIHRRSPRRGQTMILDQPN